MAVFQKKIFRELPGPDIEQAGKLSCREIKTLSGQKPLSETPWESDPGKDRFKAAMQSDTSQDPRANLHQKTPLELTAVMQEFLIS